MAKQTIHDLKLDTMNFNRHTDEGLQMIQKSLTQNGFGRSVCVDRDNNVMSGNGVVESAMALGKEKIKIVETTGDELVVVKRTDLTINSKEGRDLAMADNAVAELNWDEEAINKAKEEFNIDPTDWNINEEMFDDNKTWGNLPVIENDVEAPDIHKKAKFIIIINKKEDEETARQLIITALKDIDYDIK